MTSQRNLTGLNLGASRNLTGFTPNLITITAEEPIIANTTLNNTNITIDISPLDTATLALSDNIFVQQGSVLKKTTFTDIKSLIDTNTQYDGTAPIVLTGTTFSYDISSLGDATLALTDNIFVQQSSTLKKTTLTAIKTLIDTNTQYTARSPILLGSSTLNEFSLSTLSGYGTAGQLIVSTSSSGTGSGTSLAYSNVCKLSNIKTTNANLLEENRFFEYTTASDLITIGNNTDTITFFSKSATGSPFSINMPAVSATSTILTDTTLTATGAILLASNNISLNPSGFFLAETFDTNDKILMLDADGTTFEKITKANFISELTADLPFLTEATAVNNFGTASQTGTRTLGLLTQNTDIKGAFINNIGTTIAFQVGATVLGQFNSSNLTLNTGTLLRLGNSSVLTNSMSDVWTDCNIQTDKDINLYSVGQNFTGSLNRIGFIAGASQELTGTLGYSGSSITKANGGTPDRAGTGTIGSMFMNATGSSANISFCITTIPTDITSKVNKFIIDAVDTYTMNPIILDSPTTNQTFIDTGTNKDFILKCSGTEFLVCDASDRRHIQIGRGAFNFASYDFQTALTIRNNADDSSSSDFYQDARMRLHSVVNSTSPVIELVIDNGTNSGTLKASYVFVDSNGALFFNTGINNTANTGKQTVINGQALRTTQNVYFTDIQASGSYGVYFIIGQDPFLTSGGKGWKVDIGGTGDLHFKFNSGDLTNITQIKGYINQAVNSGQMNFTGQHRCIPKEEELYENVNDYIGYVVESTGEYNSIFTEEYEEDFELITTINDNFDPETNTTTKGYIKKETIKDKRQNQIIKNEATINEAQPIVKLTTSAKSKKVYGVISAKEDGNNRIFQVGVFASDLGERKDNRLFINGLGEGGIKVCNQNGNIENGDLLCSSDIAGIAMRQDDDIIRSYTIGKATQDYNFIDSNEKKLIGCVYYCG